jgi:DNA-binding MarR family transcriptional regulator
VRALNEWARQFTLGEPEFQVLWRLNNHSDAGLDQTSLAKALACSAAQVSAVVERLQARGWIQQRPEIHDRRRHLWQLSPAGQSLVVQFLNAGDQLQFPPQSLDPSGLALDERREAA